jgi:hypothetical protein
LLSLRSLLVSISCSSASVFASLTSASSLKHHIWSQSSQIFWQTILSDLFVCLNHRAKIIFQISWHSWSHYFRKSIVSLRHQWTIWCAFVEYVWQPRSSLTITSSAIAISSIIEPSLKIDWCWWKICSPNENKTEECIWSFHGKIRQNRIWSFTAFQRREIYSMKNWFPNPVSWHDDLSRESGRYRSVDVVWYAVHQTWNLICEIKENKETKEKNRASNSARLGKLKFCH